MSLEGHETVRVKDKSTRGLISLFLALILIVGALSSTSADETVTKVFVIEDITMQPETRWRFFTDQVMGGVWSGGVVFAQEDGQPYARMAGHISTANRGDFIQMRLDLASPPPKGTTGVRLIVRGNGQRYFVHLRTDGTALPWQYYQAGFEVTESWSEVRLPLDDFAASSAVLRGLPNAPSLASVAVVAYGRDHDAQIDVREVGFY